jgi:hypothetical protein
MPEPLSFQPEFGAVRKEKVQAIPIINTQPQLSGSQLAKLENEVELPEEETQEFGQKEVLSHTQTSAALNNTQPCQSSAQNDPSNNTNSASTTTNENSDEIAGEAGPIAGNEARSATTYYPSQGACLYKDQANEEAPALSSLDSKAANAALNCMHTAIELAATEFFQLISHQRERAEAQPQCAKPHADTSIVSKEQLFMENLAEHIDQIPEFSPRNSNVPLIMSVLAVRKSILKLIESDDAYAAPSVGLPAPFVPAESETPASNGDTDSNLFLVQPADTWQSIASNCHCSNDTTACAVIAQLNNLSIEPEKSEQNTVRLHAGMRLISPPNRESKDSIRIPYGTAWSVNELRGR